MSGAGLRNTAPDPESRRSRKRGLGVAGGNDPEVEQARARAQEHRRRVAEREAARAASAPVSVPRQDRLDEGRIPPQQRRHVRGRIVWLDDPIPIGDTGRLRIVGYDELLTPQSWIRAHVPAADGQVAA